VSFATVDGLLEAARATFRRVTADEAWARVEDGAVIVDIRPEWQRTAQGEIPGSVVVERNHLEWRLHPRSEARLPFAVDGQDWIVVCSEGYASSLAAASLVALGLEATDVVDGIVGWREAGLPLVAGGTPVEARVGEW
jgi:rhodanese-related sulfurtransferase